MSAARPVPAATAGFLTKLKEGFTEDTKLRRQRYAASAAVVGTSRSDLKCFGLPPPAIW
jgi:hypothetical protein